MSERAKRIEEAVLALASGPSEYAVDPDPCWCHARPWKAVVSPDGKDGRHEDRCLTMRTALALPVEEPAAVRYDRLLSEADDAWRAMTDEERAGQNTKRIKAPEETVTLREEPPQGGTCPGGGICDGVGLVSVTGPAGVPHTVPCPECSPAPVGDGGGR